jgi:hypothetical protein
MVDKNLRECRVSLTKKKSGMMRLIRIFDEECSSPSKFEIIRKQPCL